MLPLQSYNSRQQLSSTKFASIKEPPELTFSEGDADDKVEEDVTRRDAAEGRLAICTQYPRTELSLAVQRGGGRRKWVADEWGVLGREAGVAVQRYW